jgi:replicative DNA helicase
MSDERRPPHDVAAERSVLGGMMLARAAVDDVIESGLTGRDFYVPRHETLYCAIMRLAERGESIDMVTVAGELGRTGDLARIGGPSVVHDCVTVTPTGANAGYYARIVSEHATLRRLIAAGTRIVQLGYGGDCDVAEALTVAESELTQVTGDTKRAGDAANFGDRIDEVIEALDGPAPDVGSGVQWGFLDMDRLMGPMLAGQMIVVGARPAMGKTTFAVTVCRHAAFRQGKRVLLHSLEMSREQIEFNVLAAEARIPTTLIKRRELTMEHFTRIAKARERIDGSTFVIDGSPHLTLAGLRASIRWNKPELVVVDQLQLMTPTSSKRRGGDSRQEEVGQLSRGIKLLAKSDGVPIVVCSKINREAEKNGSDKKPTMAMLRDSGEIESDADIVLLLHREDAYDRESPRAGELDAIVAKHRTGATDTITLAAQMHYARIVDMAGDDPPDSAWRPSDILGKAS